MFFLSAADFLPSTKAKLIESTELLQALIQDFGLARHENLTQLWGRARSPIFARSFAEAFV